MKLQNLAVIFAIIVIPVTLILSAYIGTQIDTASLQQSYNTTLLDATHDAVVAFELNTANNIYSTNADSMRRDIRAAINTFSTSLATGLGIPGANSEAIMPYIPVILVTLYDGYYVYSPSQYDYQTNEKQDDGTLKKVTKTGYTHLLKPYVYYSAKYKDDSGNYIVVNYTLDNYITLYGKIGNEVISKSGYLSTKETRDYIQDAETLTEMIKYQYKVNPSADYTVVSAECPFVYQANQKVYKVQANGYNGWYTLSGLTLNKSSYNENGVDTSAKDYKKSSNDFMTYITKSISGTSISKIVTPKNQIGGTSNDITQILLTDPENQESLFNQHKRQVIRNSIQDNLNNAMAIYNANSASLGVTANFQMPKMSELDWEKIITNVNFVTFMQGFVVGTKTYNDYAIITSTNNKQYINPQSIYFVKDGKYHTIEHMATLPDVELENVKAYKSADFKKIGYEVKEDGETKNKYYYRRKEYACYDCMVSTNNMLEEKATSEKLKKIYYTALARERYNLDKITKIFL